MTQEPHKEPLATRRGMLAGVGLVGLAGAITACGASDSSSSSGAAGAATASAPTQAGPSSTGSAAASRAASAPSSASSSSSASAAGALATTSEIPVGGGMIFVAKLVVVTQPKSGEFKAFSAVCTHMGCTVGTVSNGTIDCPCHGSQYSIKNGAVLGGPAPRPLPAKQIKVTGDSIFLE